MGVLALTPTSVYPTCILSNFASINPNHLVKSATIHMIVVICYLSVMAVWAMLIRALFDLSKSSVNTAFTPCNYVWLAVSFCLLCIFCCAPVNWDWNFAHALSTLGRLSHFYQSSVSITVWYMAVYTSVMISPLSIGRPASEVNSWTPKTRSTISAKGELASHESLSCALF